MIHLDYREYDADEMLARAAAFRDEYCRRRTVRDFSDRPVSRAVIDECLVAAARAPSGANLQPWHFVVVSNPAVKRQLREAAEMEEYAGDADSHAQPDGLSQSDPRQARKRTAVPAAGRRLSRRRRRGACHQQEAAQQRGVVGRVWLPGLVGLTREGLENSRAVAV